MVVGSRRFGSDPLDISSDHIRPYSLPTPLGLHQDLSSYARAASWDPPSTTLPLTSLSSFLPPGGDADISRRPSLTSSLIRPTDASTLPVRDLHEQPNVTRLPSELVINSFPPQKPSPSASSGDPNIDEIRQSLLSMSSLNSVFPTSCNSPFAHTTLFDHQSMPSLSHPSHQQQLSFLSTSSSQFNTYPVISPPALDPNFNALTSAPLGQLAATTACNKNVFQTSSLPFGNTNLYPYPGSMAVVDISQAAGAANNNENMDDSRHDSSLWRPY